MHVGCLEAPTAELLWRPGGSGCGAFSLAFPGDNLWRAVDEIQRLVSLVLEKWQAEPFMGFHYQIQLRVLDWTRLYPKRFLNSQKFGYKTPLRFSSKESYRLAELGENKIFIGMGEI